MEFMGEVTALQLAQLAANLKMAGIIPSLREPQDCQDAAVPPLEVTGREKLESTLRQENEQPEYDLLKKTLKSPSAQGKMHEMEDTELKLRGQAIKFIELEDKLRGQIRRHRENETGVSNRDLVLEAAEFLALCNEVKTVLSEAQRWEDLKSEIGKELDAVVKESNYDRVPVKELIRIAGASRLKLTSIELSQLNVTKNWEEMTSDEQAVEIFMHLSSRQFQGAFMIPDRQTGKFYSWRSYLFEVGLNDAYESERWVKFIAQSDKDHAKSVSSDTRTDENTQPALKPTGDKERDNEAARRKLCQLGIHPHFDTLLNIVVSLREAKALRDTGLKRSAAIKSRQGEGKKAKGPKTERRSDGTLGKQNRDNETGKFRKKRLDSVFAAEGSTPDVSVAREGRI